MKILISLFLWKAIVVTACPFGNAKTELSDEILTSLARLGDPNHPPIQRRTRSLQGEDDPRWDYVDEDGVFTWPELIPMTGPEYGGLGVEGSLYNNTMVGGSLTNMIYQDPDTGKGMTLPDIIALYQQGLLPGLENAPGVGQELCYFSMQSLPPPLWIEDSSAVVPRTVDGESQTFYKFPKVDLPRYMELADMAVRRLTTFIEEGSDVVMLGACSSGSESAKALCAENISGVEGTQCLDARMNAAVGWPQAMAIFKVDAQNPQKLLDFLNTDWRSNADIGHLPNIFWATQPNGTSIPGNEDAGGIFASTYAGWGNNGGLRSKIVQCDKINPKFIRHMNANGSYVMGSDAIDEETGNTFSVEVFKEWDRLCSISFGPPNSNCTIDADVPAGSNLTATNTSQKPYAILPNDENCTYEIDYIDNARSCGIGLSEQWGNNTLVKKFEEEYANLIAGCGEAFCNSLASWNPDTPGTNLGVDENGFFYCEVESWKDPSICSEGISYMEAMSAFSTCALEAGKKVTASKKEVSANSTSASAGASFDSCSKMIECEEKSAESITLEWKTRFCINFFETLRHPAINPGDTFAWVEECGFRGDGSADSEIYKTCETIFAGNQSGVGNTTTIGSGTQGESTAAPGAGSGNIFAHNQSGVGNTTSNNGGGTGGESTAAPEASSSNNNGEASGAAAPLGWLGHLLGLFTASTLALHVV